MVNCNQKHMFGFDNSPDETLTIVCGDSYPYKDWLRDQGARFSNYFNWYFVDSTNLPELPSALTYYSLSWSSVSQNETDLRDVKEVKRIVHDLTSPKIVSNSKYFGTIGERYPFIVTVKRNIKVESNYGTSNMHVMEDSDGNIFIWTTQSKDWEEGSTQTFNGTIKAHSEYQGVQQTILTNCRVKKEKK